MTDGGRMRPSKTRWSFVGAGLVLLINVSPAFAVHTPFGIATPNSGGAGTNGPLGGLFLWVALRQAEFYRALTTAILSLKNSGHAFWLLAALSFAYGIFHAVGPGHGKSVVTSYLLVTRQTVRRGILISFAAGLAQALTAIAVVTGVAIILKATAIGMTQTTDWFPDFQLRAGYRGRRLAALVKADQSRPPSSSQPCVAFRPTQPRCARWSYARPRGAGAPPRAYFSSSCTRR